MYSVIITARTRAGHSLPSYAIAVNGRAEAYALADDLRVTLNAYASLTHDVKVEPLV